MRLSEYCSAQDIDRAIAVTVDSFIGSQKVSCKKALSRAFAKYVSVDLRIRWDTANLFCSVSFFQVYAIQTKTPIQAPCRYPHFEPSHAAGSIHRALNHLRRIVRDVRVVWFLLCLIPLCLHFICVAFYDHGSVLERGHDAVMNGEAMNHISNLYMQSIL